MSSDGDESVSTRLPSPRASSGSHQGPGRSSSHAGIPVKVISERLRHATPVLAIDTYQHLPRGMQADAARVFERTAFHALPADERGRSVG